MKLTTLILFLLPPVLTSFPSQKRWMDRKVSSRREALLLQVQAVDDVLCDKTMSVSRALMDPGLTEQKEQTGLGYVL